MTTELYSPASQDVVAATISFIDNDEDFINEKPYMSLLPSDGTFPTTNCTFSSSHTVPIVDMRPNLPLLSLDNHGFFILPHPLRFPNLITTAIGKQHPPEDLLTYVKEVTDITKTLLGAEKAICIDWRFRKASPEDSIDLCEDKSYARDLPIQPAYKAHSDLSPQGGWMTLRAYLSAAELAMVESKEWRARVINCWRPLVPVVNDCPLAYCRPSTVLAEDCILYDRVDGSTGGEGTFLKRSDKHEWQWVSKQTWDELSVFQSWDSSDQNFRGLTFHAAFQHPNWDGVGPNRESLELRIIILSKIQPDGRVMRK